MNLKKVIFTINARDNIVLNVCYKESSPFQYYKEINSVFEMFKESLSKQNIDYNKLKNALVPRKKRKEIALVFDTQVLKESIYDYFILNKILPLLGKDSPHSILVGDFAGDTSKKHEIRNLFFENLIQTNPTDYEYHNQYFVVYINNLSDSMVTNLVEELKIAKYFTGYFDLSFSSEIKTKIATIVSPRFIKSKSHLILCAPHATNIIDEIPTNTSDYEDLGFQCVFIHQEYFHLFLSYKIERQILVGIEKDTDYSLNMLTSEFVDLSECKIEISPERIMYLRKAKGDNFERAGLINHSSPELETIISKRIENNYIYNLTFKPEYDVLQFDILMEFKRIDKEQLMKMRLGMKYQPKEKKLILITMF